VKHYYLRLFPEQPVCLEDETTIPAAALRGAVAASLLSTCARGHEHDTGPCGAGCRYWSFFGDGANVRFSPAYAGSSDTTQPLLATARTCSAYPGFKTASGHGVFDVAIRQWVFEQVCVQPQRLLAPFSLRCPTCAGALEPFEGLATRQGDREFAAVRDIATHVQMTHVSLGRTRKQIVERYQVGGKLLNRGIYYVAKVDVPDRLDSLLHDAVAGGLWIGGHRSRGMGAMRAELVSRPSDQLALAERIVRFNQAVRAEYRFYTAMDAARPAGDDGEWYFTLDLHSPMLRTYDAGPSPVLASLPGVAPVRQWLSADTITGWHSAAGLPRRTQPGATGVTLFRVSAEANRLTVEEMLAFIESEGVGTGRERGFGTATICDPFHLLMDPL
jgi:CRISPR-associated Csx10 family RAMP protein